MVRRDVDVEPGEIDPGSVVSCDGAQEGAEKPHAVRDGGTKDQGVADDADAVCQREEGRAKGEVVGEE